MEKQSLTITRCKVTADGQTKPSGSHSDIFEATLNPASYQHSLSISYSKEADANAQAVNRKPLGQTAVESRFAAINAEKVAFDLVLDGTGVVRKEGKRVPDVKAEIEQLKNIVYRYVGDKHEPSVVKLAWGELNTFYGRMESMAVEYTLFRPNGLPLRAKVKLRFVSFMTQVEASLRANRSSPDLSHLVEVRDGDTLPWLCQLIYNDSSRYIEVARANKLTNFRALVPGTRLRFPPLK